MADRWAATVAKIHAQRHGSHHGSVEPYRFRLLTKIIFIPQLIHGFKGGRTRGISIPLLLSRGRKGGD